MWKGIRVQPTRTPPESEIGFQGVLLLEIRDLKFDVRPSFLKRDDSEPHWEGEAKGLPMLFG